MNLALIKSAHDSLDPAKKAQFEDESDLTEGLVTELKLRLNSLTKGKREPSEL